MSGNAPVGTEIPGGEGSLDPAHENLPPIPPGHRRLRRTLLSAALVLLVVGLIAASVVTYAFFKLRAGPGSPCAACSAEASGPMNVLVLGSDQRPPGAEDAGGQRADTIAILHVDFAVSRAVVISLPRDLRVKAPDGAFVKINSFYNQGAPAMVQAVTAFTGLPINHYVEVNFTGFRNIVDTLGGVRIRFSRPVVDPDSGLNVPAGCVTLDGDQALAFVRVRHIDSDYGRIARQQFFSQLVMSRVLSAGTLLNPLKLVSLINVGAANVRTDSGLGVSTMRRLAVELRNFDARDVDFRVVPSVPQSIGGVSYVIPLLGQSTALFDAVRTNRPLPDYGRQGTALMPSSVRATVLNGTTPASLVTQAASDLKAAGYQVIATGPADRTGYAATVVYYTPGNADKATLLSQVYGGAPVQPLPSQIQAGGDAVVVLGQDYAQGKVTAVPSASATPFLPAGPAEVIPASALDVSAC